MAFKEARVRFHPDRAASCGLAEQAAAEETFKLLMRERERLPLVPMLPYAGPSSWY